MRAFILAVTGVKRHFGAKSLTAFAVAVILSCSNLVSTGSDIESVTVALTTSSSLVGQRVSAVATLRDETGLKIQGQPITWSLSNPAVASIEGSGSNVEIVTLAAGATEVTATSGGRTGRAALDVAGAATVPVASTTVTLAAGSLDPGQTTQATATTRDATDQVLTDRAVTWASSNISVATVSATGLVTAAASGTAQITGTSEGKSGSAGLTVRSLAPPPAPVASVTVTVGNSSLRPGQTTQAVATTRDAQNNILTGRAVSWTSSNPGVANVSTSGLVSGLTPGSAQITATSEGQPGSVAVTVALAPVASVTVSPATASIAIGQTRSLSATLRDAAGNTLSGRTIVWSSSNTSIATVASSGVVTAVAAGPATIAALSESISGTASITVPVATPPPPPGGASPEPGAGDVILLQDDFNRPTVAELVAPYDRRGMFQLTDGYSGNAIRFPYTAASWDNLIEKSFPVTTDVYFRYRYRLSPGADPTCGNREPSGFKWFMPWRRGSTERYTMGVGNLGGGPAGFENTGLEFSSHDNSSRAQPSPFMQNINKTKTFGTTADGAWHTYTLHIVTTPNGYEQIWIDGVLVLDNSGFGYDHDPVGIGLFQFPGTMVRWFTGCDFTVDVDDFVIWRK